MRIYKYLAIITIITFIMLAGCVSQPEMVYPNSIVFENPRDSSLYYYHLPSNASGILLNESNIVKTNSYVRWFDQIDPDYQYYTYITDYTEDGLNMHSFYGLPNKIIDVKVDDKFPFVSSDLRWTVLFDAGHFKIYDRLNNKRTDILQEGNNVTPFDLVNNTYLYYYKDSAQGSTPVKNVGRLNIKTGQNVNVDVPHYFQFPIISPNGEYMLIPQFSNISRETKKDANYSLLLFDFPNNSSKVIEGPAENDNGNPVWVSDHEFAYQKINIEHSKGINWADIENKSCSKEIFTYDIGSDQKQSLYKSTNECLLLEDVNLSNDTLIVVTVTNDESSYAIQGINIDSGQINELYKADYPIDYLSQVHLEPNKINEAK